MRCSRDDCGPYPRWRLPWCLSPRWGDGSHVHCVSVSQCGLVSNVGRGGCCGNVRGQRQGMRWLVWERTYVVGGSWVPCRVCMRSAMSGPRRRCRSQYPLHVSTSAYASLDQMIRHVGRHSAQTLRAAVCVSPSRSPGVFEEPMWHVHVRVCVCMPRPTSRRRPTCGRCAHIHTWRGPGLAWRHYMYAHTLSDIYNVNDRGQCGVDRNGQ